MVHAERGRLGERRGRGQPGVRRGRGIPGYLRFPLRLYPGWDQLLQPLPEGRDVRKAGGGGFRGAAGGPGPEPGAELHGAGNGPGGALLSLCLLGDLRGRGMGQGNPRHAGG